MMGCGTMISKSAYGSNHNVNDVNSKAAKAQRWQELEFIKSRMAGCDRWSKSRTTSKLSDNSGGIGMNKINRGNDCLSLSLNSYSNQARAKRARGDLVCRIDSLSQNISKNNKLRSNINDKTTITQKKQSKERKYDRTMHSGHKTNNGKNKNSNNNNKHNSTTTIASENVSNDKGCVCLTQSESFEAIRESITNQAAYIIDEWIANAGQCSYHGYEPFLFEYLLKKFFTLEELLGTMKIINKKYKKLLFFGNKSGQNIIGHCIYRQFCNLRALNKQSEFYERMNMKQECDEKNENSNTKCKFNWQERRNLLNNWQALDNDNVEIENYQSFVKDILPQLCELILFFSERMKSLAKVSQKYSNAATQNVYSHGSANEGRLPSSILKKYKNGCTHNNNVGIKILGSYVESKNIKENFENIFKNLSLFMSFYRWISIVIGKLNQLFVNNNGSYPSDCDEKYNDEDMEYKYLSCSCSTHFGLLMDFFSYFFVFGYDSQLNNGIKYINNSVNPRIWQSFGKWLLITFIPKMKDMTELKIDDICKVNDDNPRGIWKCNNGKEIMRKPRLYSSLEFLLSLQHTINVKFESEMDAYPRLNWKQKTRISNYKQEMDRDCKVLYLRDKYEKYMSNKKKTWLDSCLTFRMSNILSMFILSNDCWMTQKYDFYDITKTSLSPANTIVEPQRIELLDSIINGKNDFRMNDVFNCTLFYHLKNDPTLSLMRLLEYDAKWPSNKFKRQKSESIMSMGSRNDSYHDLFDKPLAIEDEYTVQAIEEMSSTFIRRLSKREKPFILFGYVCWFAKCQISQSNYHVFSKFGSL